MLQMTYSYDNPFVMPTRAFEMGNGYCVQQAYCMNRILRALGFDCELVYSTKVEVRNKIIDGKTVEPFTSGHTWNRVTIDGATKDVCTTNASNRPGQVSFTPIAPVKHYGPVIAFAGYLGSIPECMRLKRKYASE